MDRTKMQAQRKLTQLAGGTTLALLLGSGAVLAETQGCALVNGVLPEGCFQANEGQVVAREVGANTEDDGTSALGGLGFSISIDPVSPGGPRQTIAGETPIADFASVQSALFRAA